VKIQNEVLHMLARTEYFYYGVEKKFEVLRLSLPSLFKEVLNILGGLIEFMQS